MDNNIENTEEIILEDNQILCVLTDQPKKSTSKEENLQSTIRMLNEEYGFDLSDMKRDFTISFIDPESGKSKKQKVELVIFDKGAKHDQENIVRVAIVQDDKTKENDKKKGVQMTLENAMAALDNCEFGLWTNGIDIKYLQREDDAIGFDYIFSDLSDIPGFGENINDLERPERSHSRKPANDSLIKVFKRSHDYIYANEGRKKDAFWQLLYLIFCKLYDEKRRFTDYEKGISYRKKFWVGVKEQNTDEGRKAVADRIKSLFTELKEDDVFSGVQKKKNNHPKTLPKSQKFLTDLKVKNGKPQKIHFIKRCLSLPKAAPFFFHMWV